jgi:hypothetical protein
MRSYSHLSEDERDQIGVLRAAGRSMGAIARALGRAKGELQRNALPSGGYSPLHVAGAYQLRPRFIISSVIGCSAVAPTIRNPNPSGEPPMAAARRSLRQLLACDASAGGRDRHVPSTEVPIVEIRQINREDRDRRPRFRMLST